MAQLQAEAVALLCWPQSEHTSNKNLAWIGKDAPARDKDLPPIMDGLVVELAQLLGVDSAGQWAAARLAGPQQDIVAQFVQYLRKDELLKLAKEMKLTPTDKDAKTTGSLKTWLLRALQGGATFPLPKALTVKTTPAPKAKAKPRKKAKR